MYLCSTTLSQILLKKFLREIVFFKFKPPDYFRETKICFLAAILKLSNFLFFIYLFIFFAALGVSYTGMVQVWYQNSYGKVLQNTLRSQTTRFACRHGLCMMLTLKGHWTSVTSIFLYLVL